MPLSLNLKPRSVKLRVRLRKLIFAHEKKLTHRHAQMNKLAIVIPYYKIDFFEETLQSVAAQTDKRFSLYIGNDKSPHDPLPLIQKYFPEGSYRYFNYEENLGGKNLAMQWERILENVTEEWFQILGDDDMISDNFVEEFYRNSEKYQDINFIKCRSYITDSSGGVSYAKSEQVKTGYYSAIDFFIKKIKGEINSSLSEHIFRNSAYIKYRFKKYPLAWHTDDYFLLEIASDRPNFYFQSNVKVFIKETEKSISGSDGNTTEKEKATFQFYNDCLALLKDTATIRQKDFFANFLNTKYFKIRARTVFLTLFSKSEALVRMCGYYSNRFINKAIPYDSLKIRLKKKYLYWNYRQMVKRDTLIRRQRENPLEIPVIIINFNQLFYLRKLVGFLKQRGFINIVIVDNQSSYPPLLAYYETLTGVTVEHMDDNYGHKVFFENEILQKKYGQGYYIITDADILPNENLPIDFVSQLIKQLDLNFINITKVGFALKIDDLPEGYSLREKVIKWEKQFWQNPIDKNIYKNFLDTTFAIYKPQYPQKFYNMAPYLSGIRMAGDFTAVHGGWYFDPENMSDEQKYYSETANTSASWRVTNEGKHGSSEYDKFIT